MAKDKTEEQKIEDQAEEATTEVPEIEKKEEEEKTIPILVVKELPQIETRTGQDAEGNEYALITQDEAITEIYNDMKALRKGIG